jgi:hypothetical protein
LFREINEQVKELNLAFSFVVPGGEWICECANDSCTDRIEMPPKSTRRYGGTEHASLSLPATSTSGWMSRTNDRYWIVEKTTGQARVLAKRADPAL